VIEKRSKYYLARIPFKYMKMKNLYFTLVAVACIAALASCGILGKKNSKGGSLPMNGQVHGVCPFKQVCAS